MTLNLLNERINCHDKFNDDRLIDISFFSAQTVDISTGLWTDCLIEFLVTCHWLL